MVSKPEIQSSTIAVVEYLKRDSSFEECATKSKVEVYNMNGLTEIQRLNNSTNKPKIRNRRLTVTFSVKNDVFEIARRNSEEKNDMHMSPEDQRLIIREITKAMRQFECDEESFKDLGINRLVEQQDPKRIARVRSAILAVLQRQRQSKLFPSSNKMTQTINEVWLEKHYRSYSKISANLARNRGLEDQELVPFYTPRKLVMSR